MKKMAIFFIFACGCASAYAATTCIHNRTVVFTIKKSELPISSSSNASEMTWTLNFGYDLMPGGSGVRTLAGISTCNEITTNTAEGAVKKGDANVYLRASTADTGTQCWCALDGPITSWWVFLKSYADEDSCSSGCAPDCAAAAKGNTDNFLSNGIYRAIW